jgi:tRNA(fMet)-specific endonuclease VapC
LIDWERSASARGLDALLGGEERAISVITVSELLHGAHRESAYRRTPRRAFVEALLAAFDPIPVTEPVARVHAEIWAELADRGAVIGAHDLWIAATALAHGLGVATHNVAHYQRVSGLRVLGPDA